MSELTKIFNYAMSSVNYHSNMNGKPTIEAAVMKRGTSLGKWTGSGYEYDCLCRTLTGTGITLYVIHKTN